MDTKSKLICNAITLGLLIGLAGSCAGDRHAPLSRQPLPETPVAEIIRLDTTIHKEYVATIQAFKNVEIRSRLTGFLEKIYVDEGSQVHQGQPLFKLNESEYRSEVARCEALLENAVADRKTIALEVERTKLLVDKNIVSDTELEVAEAKLSAADSRIKEAKSILDHAKTQLAYTTIVAPFTGKIDRIPLKEGSLLDEGTLLTSISDLQKVYAYFDISEKEYLRMTTIGNAGAAHMNMPAKLTLADGTPYPHAGQAEFAENEFDQTTGTISLRAVFPNPDGLIKHAATGKVGIPLQSGQNLAVHQKAVFEIQDRTYVYKVQNDSTVVMTPFRAGQRVGHYYLVEGGLHAHDKIVFEGVQHLKDGMKILPQLISSAGSRLAAAGAQ